MACESVLLLAGRGPHVEGYGLRGTAADASHAGDFRDARSSSALTRSMAARLPDCRLALAAEVADAARASA